MEHLFDAWPRVRVSLQEAERLLLMLDFDGTLSQIVEEPDDARLLPEAREPLAALAKNRGVHAAVITGRALADVRHRLGVEGVDIVGNHGRERLRPGGDVEQLAGETRRIGEVLEEIQRRVGDIPGVAIEDKGPTAAIHFRRAPESAHSRVREAARETARKFEGIVEISEGKRVFDIVPVDSFHKGRAALTLLDEEGGPGRALPIYLGDDTTDETAFQALPPEALTIYIGEPKPSAARYCLDDPQQVAEFLQRVAETRAPA